jgi:hypothetical protein
MNRQSSLGSCFNFAAMNSFAPVVKLRSRANFFSDIQQETKPESGTAAAVLLCYYGPFHFSVLMLTALKEQPNRRNASRAVMFWPPRLPTTSVSHGGHVVRPSAFLSSANLQCCRFFCINVLESIIPIATSNCTPARQTYSPAEGSES